MTRNAHHNFPDSKVTSSYVFSHQKSKIPNIYLGYHGIKLRKAANPHNREAGTRECLAFLQETMMQTTTYTDTFSVDRTDFQF